ncbi:MAG: hypothetical protein HY674_12400 [Chloroflexi bacterium]|nr:hypothetical protein [Chloroflexota bacterium]
MIVATGSSRAETHFFEDFEGTNAPLPQCWWHAGNPAGKAQLTSEKAFSGNRSALIESGNGYWEIALPKPLKWNRKDPAGAGNRPLYLSMRVYAAGTEAQARPGLRIRVVPKRHPSFGGCPLEDPPQAHVAGRIGEWLLLCLDVGQALRKDEAEGRLNPDHVVLESVSLFTSTDGKYYLDDVRLSNERPEGCSPPRPPPPKASAAAHYRPDSKLESMVLHGVYDGIGSAIVGDIQLHASSVRDMKRHYLNFVSGLPYGILASEPILRGVEHALDQAAQYDILLMPKSYIGSRYANNEVKAWSDEKLRAEMLKIVRRFKNKTHLLGWYLEEETASELAQTCLKEKRWVEEEDPQRSVWNIFNVGPPLQEFGAAYAVITLDHYPVQGPNPNPWAVPQYLARSVPKFKQPFLLTDQIFAGGSGWTVPTLGQYRLMVYGAMAEGVKGFFHFLYFAELLYRVRGGERLYGCMVDVYGTPSPIYREIERHLGPDLFSFGELLRTSRPDQVPAEIRVECAKVEDSLERELPAIALRRLADAAGSYEIIALYSNDPDKAQSGTLHIPLEWLGERIVMDLSAHSRNILSQTAIQVEGERVPVRLDPGDGRFLAVATEKQSGELIRRMQSRRFEALRKMVEFDCRWLAQVKVGTPYSAQQWADLQQVCDRKSPHDALRQVMRLDEANQALIGKSPLAPVLRDLDVARQNLSAACDAIGKWAVPQENGGPFPPDVAPGKSYCDVQDKLGELYVGFSDLAYSHTPEVLVRPVAKLAGLCAKHAEQLKKGSGQGVPKEPCRLTLDALKSLEKQLADARL